MSLKSKWSIAALALAGVMACMKAGDGVGADAAGRMCTAASTDSACIAYLDPCKADPTATGCAVDCAKNPSAAGCPVDSCKGNPALPGCKLDCAASPTAQVCIDSCKTHADLAWCSLKVDCAAAPTAQICVDSCAVNPALAFCKVDCAVKPDDPSCGPPKTKFSEVYAVITGSTCMQCHVPGAPGVLQGKLNMATSDSAYANLVGMLATDQTLAPGLVRVKAKSADSSILVLKIEAGLKGVKPKLPDGTTYYDAMPLTGAPLTRAKIDLIRKWIQDGAVK